MCLVKLKLKKCFIKVVSDSSGNTFFKFFLNERLQSIVLSLGRKLHTLPHTINTPLIIIYCVNNDHQSQ